MTKATYEEALQQLVGQRIASVKYYEIDYDYDEPVESKRPYWTHDKDFDSLDFGCELRMESGRVFQILWGDVFAQYDVDFYEDKEIDCSWMRWDVTDCSRWSTKIGLPIQAVRVFWENDSIDPRDAASPASPQDVELCFEGAGSIWLSALEIVNESRFHQQDHITVVFDPEMVARYRLGKLGAALH